MKPTPLKLRSFGLWLTALILLCACQQPTDSPEAAIEKQLQLLEAGIEEKDADQVMELIHDQFGTRAGADRQWLKRTLAFYMFKHQRLSVLRSNEVIEVDGASAQVSLRVVVTGGEGLIPNSGGLYDMTSEWRLHDGSWLLVYAEWKRPG